MKFVIGAAYGNNTNQHHKTVFFPISKGSSYLIDGNVYYQAIYFVPCKYLAKQVISEHRK